MACSLWTGTTIEMDRAGFSASVIPLPLPHLSDSPPPQDSSKMSSHCGPSVGPVIWHRVRATHASPRQYPWDRVADVPERLGHGDPRIARSHGAAAVSGLPAVLHVRIARPGW